LKILFVSGNKEQLPNPVVPLGLLYIIANTPEQHDCALTDLCFENEPAEALKAAIRREQPDLIAISMRNIQNNDYTGLSDNLNYYEKLVTSCRSACDAPVVVGGSGFSVMPKELMEKLKPDFGIPGEGEHAFPLLLEALEEKRPFHSVPLLHAKSADTEQITVAPPAADFLDMATLVSPKRDLIQTRYFSEYGMDSVQTKRGCPLRCEYCTYPIIEGRKGRLRPAKSIVDEMFQSVEQNPDINHFFVVDSVFNLPKSHAKRVCRELISRQWKIPWTCYANPLGFDQEFADLAAEAGCAGMEIGSDSGVDSVLKRLRKGFTTEHISKLNSICTQAGVPDCHTFILGTEGETLKDSETTLKFLDELNPFAAIIMVWTDDYESLDPALREQRLGLREEINELLRSKHKAQPTWSMPGLGINFSEDLFNRMRAAGLHGPLWQHVRGAVRRKPCRPAMQSL